jgi:hypothetical protein
MTGNTATSEAPPLVSWHRIDETDLPAEGRVRSAVVDGRSDTVSRCAGRQPALDPWPGPAPCRAGRRARLTTPDLTPPTTRPDRTTT